MSAPEKSIRDLELKISRFLRSGVSIAALLLATGWGWLLLSQHGNTFDKFFSYQTPVTFHENFQWALLTNDRGTLFASAGLVILISLPVIRVFLTGIVFFHNKEYRLSFMAFIVFVTLLLSFFLGFTEG